MSPSASAYWGVCLCRHVKHGWKPVTTPEQALFPNSIAEPTDTSHNKVIDSSKPCQASDTLRTGPKLCPLPEYDLRNSVMVTTYSRTPYFYEGIEPHMTPKSRFPTDKLKMQVVVEQEEEEEEFLPRPQKVCCWSMCLRPLHVPCRFRHTYTEHASEQPHAQHVSTCMMLPLRM